MIGWLAMLAFSYLEFAGLVVLLGLLIVVVVAVGRECWLGWRAAPQIEALNECWSIPAREPIRTKLP